MRYGSWLRCCSVCIGLRRSAQRLSRSMSGMRAPRRPRAPFSPALPPDFPRKRSPHRPAAGLGFPSTPPFFALGNPGAPSFTSGGPFPEGALSFADWGGDRLSQAHDKYLQKRSSREGGYFWFWCFHNISHDPVAPEKDRLRTPVGLKVPHINIVLLSGRKYHVYKGASVTYSFIA